MNTGLFAGMAEKRHFAFLVIAVISFLTYFQVYSFEFCYDDFFSVLPIQDVDKLSSILRYFHEPVRFLNPDSGVMESLPYYRPIATSTLTIDIFLFGKENPGWLHVENLILHTVNGCILFLIARELLGNALLSLLAATLYIVFPFSTEIVSIYHYRVDLVTNLFIFLTLLATLHGSGKGWQWKVSLLFLLAMLSKEAAISLLVLIPLFRHFRHKVLNATELLVALGLPMLVYWSLRYNTLGAFLHPEGAFEVDDFVAKLSFGERLIHVLESFCQKVVFLVLPYSISPKIFMPENPSQLHLTLALLILLALTVGALYYLKRSNLPSLLCFAFLASWFPVSSILIGIPDFVSPRLFYYPSPWIMVSVAFLLGLVPKDSWKAGLAAVLLSLWMSASFLQKNWYENNLTKSLGSLAFNPYHPGTMIVAANEFYKRNNIPYAIQYYNNVLAVLETKKDGLKESNALTAFTKLAEIHLRQKETDKALFVLEHARKSQPDKGILYYLSAIAYLEQGKREEAERMAREGRKTKDFEKLLAILKAKNGDNFGE